MQVNAVSIAKTGVAAIRQSRPADAADHVDAEAEDDEYRDRRIEMEVGAGNHRGDDQCDDEREKLKHGDRNDWHSVAFVTWQKNNKTMPSM